MRSPQSSAPCDMRNVLYTVCDVRARAARHFLFDLEGALKGKEKKIRCDHLI